LTIFSQPVYYHLLATSPLLSRLWNCLWLTEQRPFVEQRLLAGSRKVEDILLGCYLRIDILERLWAELVKEEAG
jgi:hypothetical protein